jgi:uncharacterized protein
MTLISMTFLPPLTGLIEDLIADDLLQAIEVVPDEFFSDTSPIGLSDELGDKLSHFRLPYSFHFVSNSLCSADFLENHDRGLTNLKGSYQPILVSDHLTCSRIGHQDITGNLPTLYTNETLEITAENIRYYQQRIPSEAPFLLEHIPMPFDLKQSTLSWDEFYLGLIQHTDAGVLLDLHNLYCEEQNNDFDAIKFMKQLPKEKVLELHVAGGYLRQEWNYYVDCHCQHVPERVFELVEVAMNLFSPKLVNLERENNFVEFDRIRQDIERLNQLCRN